MDLPPPPNTSDISELFRWCERLWFWLDYLHFNRNFVESATWDAASIADGDEEAKGVTVTGAALGDFAIASLSIDVADLVLDAQVTAANTVTCVLANNTGAGVDLASATVYVLVIKKQE